MRSFTSSAWLGGMAVNAIVASARKVMGFIL